MIKTIALDADTWLRILYYICYVNVKNAIALRKCAVWRGFRVPAYMEMNQPLNVVFIVRVLRHFDHFLFWQVQSVANWAPT